MMTPARARAIAEYVALDSVEQEVRAALLAYAAMVERCEEVRKNLELNRKDYSNREVRGSLVETNNDEIAMLDYIEKGKQK